MAPRQKLSYVDDAVSVGRRLRAAREQAGISQRALSFPGCTAAYISRIENGERIPSLQLLREFAARLGVGEQYLAYGRDDVPTAQTSPTEARVAIRMGDFDTARELANAALDGARSDVEQAAAFSLLGEVALAEGEIVAARAVARARPGARSDDRGSRPAYRRVARARVRTGLRVRDGRGGLRAEPRPRDRQAGPDQRGALRQPARQRSDRLRQFRRGRGVARRRDQGERDRGRSAHGGPDVLVAVPPARTPAGLRPTPLATPSAPSSCSRPPTSTTTSRASIRCSRTSSSIAATTSAPRSCSTARLPRSSPAAASSSSRASASSRRGRS